MTKPKNNLDLFDKRFAVNSVRTKELEGMPDRIKVALKKYMAEKMNRPIHLPTRSDPLGVESLPKDNILVRFMAEYSPSAVIEKAVKNRSKARKQKQKSVLAKTATTDVNPVKRGCGRPKKVVISQQEVPVS